MTRGRMKRHKWDHPRRTRGKQPKCVVCGQGAPSWVEDFFGVWTTDGGVWGSHVPVRPIQTVFCPGRWTGAREYMYGGRWVPCPEKPPGMNVTQEMKDKYRSKRTK